MHAFTNHPVCCVALAGCLGSVSLCRFDRVFGEDARQEDVFNNVARGTINKWACVVGRACKQEALTCSLPPQPPTAVWRGTTAPSLPMDRWVCLVGVSVSIHIYIYSF